ncbi:HIT domain-containing protein [bacterium]|nr:HIT domain-containing protein [bacterium]
MKKRSMESEGDKSGIREKICRVIFNYQSVYAQPLAVHAGEKLRVGERKSKWSGWVWCTNQKGQSGWVPERYVERSGNSCTARCDYDASELSVHTGEELIVGREESGWIWCTNQKGQSGWVPAENMELISTRRQIHAHEGEGCAFCNVPQARVIRENELAFVIRDDFPVTPLHTLIIPKRHVSGYFDLNSPEISACQKLLAETRDEILSADSSVKGFNIGVNQGAVAGQTIFHCHIHLIPRREGDVQKPQGGVRHVIPGKGCY